MLFRRNAMKKLGVLFVFAMLACLMWAAIGEYTVTSSTVDPGYLDASESLMILNSSLDEGMSSLIDIGFPFVYDGSIYTQFKACTNGYITFDASADPIYNNSLAANKLIIAPLWDDMTTGPVGAVYYQLQGSAPNRIAVVEYKAIRWPYNSISNNITFQIKLYEGTNEIAFNYLSIDFPGSSASASIGISGSTTGDFLSILPTYVDFEVNTESEHQFIGDAQVNHFKWKKYTLTPPAAPENDLALVALEGPSSTFLGGSARIKATVMNLGSNTQESYSVSLRSFTGAPIETQNNLTPIAAGQSQNFFFSWYPLDAGNQQLFAEVNLAGDENLDNNSSDLLGIIVFEEELNLISIGEKEGSGRIPLDFHYKSSVSQSIYTQDEINAIGHIEAISLKNNFTSNMGSKPVQIWMGTTTEESFGTNWIEPSSLSMVFDGWVDFPVGENSILFQLDEAFTYSQDNLVIMFKRPLDSEYYSSTDNFWLYDTNEYRNKSTSEDYLDIDVDDLPQGNNSSFSPVIDLYYSPFDSPVFHASHTNIHFPNQQINTSRTQAITVGNWGSGILEISSIDIVGDPEFTLSRLPWIPHGVDAGESFSFNVSYDPLEISTVRADEATISIEYSTGVPGDLPWTHTIDVSGIAIDSSIGYIPYYEGFDGDYEMDELPLGWSKYEGIDSHASMVGITGMDAYSEPYSVQLYKASDTPEGVFLILPILTDDIALSELRLSFKTANVEMKSSSDGSTRAINAEIVDLGVMTDPDDISTFVLLQSFSSSYPWQSYNYDFSLYTSDAKYIAFRNASGYYSSMLLIDDVSLDYIPANDLMVTVLELPNVVSQNQNISVSVTLKNNGSNPQDSYSVELKSVVGATLASAAGPYLFAGQSLDVILNWVPQHTGLQKVFATVNLLGDENEDNDSSDIKETYVLGSGYAYQEVGLGGETQRVPLDFYYRSSLSQNLYLQTELEQYGTLNSLTLFNDFENTIDATPVKIWMGTTPLNNLQSQHLPYAQMSLVFDGNLSFPSGENMVFINLDTPFEYEQDNLVIMYLRPLDTQWYSSGDMFKSDYGDVVRTKILYSDSVNYDPSSVNFNNADSSYYLAKTGFVFAGSTAEPTMSYTITPRPLDFGDVTMGETETKYVTIENTGEVELTVDDIYISGDDFMFADGFELPIVIPVGETAEVYIVFNAYDFGLFENDMIFLSDAGEDQITLKANVPEHSVYIEPEILNFGDVLVGQYHYRSVQVSNTGTTNFTILDVSFESDDSCFSFSYPSLPLSLAPDADTNLSLTFYTEDYGHYDDTMYITTNGGTHSVFLHATAWEEPLIANPQSISFGHDIPLAHTSTRNLNLLHNFNSGMDSFWIDNVVLADQTKGFSLDEAIYNDVEMPVELPYNLANGESLDFKVHFLPLEPLAKTTSIIVYYGESQMLRIPVSAFEGTVVGAEPEISVSQEPIFHVLAPYSHIQRYFTIQNTGTEILEYEINTDGFGDDVSFTPESGTVNPGSQASIEYSITSGEAMPWVSSHSLQITSNDPLRPTVEIPFAYAVTQAIANQAFMAYPTQGDQPLTVRFSLLPGIEGLRYSWDFDNNGSFDSYEPEPLHTYTAAGVYSVRLTLLLPTGVSKQYLLQDYITVGTVGPSVLPDAISYIEFYQNQVSDPYLLSDVFAAPAGTWLDYYVQPSAHIRGIVNQWGVMTLTAANNWWGTETITVVATDPYQNTCSHQIVVNVIHVNAAPMLSIPNDLHFIHRSSFMVDFSDYIYDLDDDIQDLGISLSRISGDETIQFAYYPINQANIPGQHTVIFSSLEEASQTTRFNIAVNDFHTRAISNAAFNMHVLDHFEAEPSTATSYQYTGQSVHFRDVTLGNPNYWLWNFGDGNSSTEKHPIHIYEYAGSYDVSLTVGHDLAEEEDSTTRMDYIHMQGTYVTPGNLPPVWSPAGSPYNLFGGFTFDEDDDLTIEEGVDLNIFGDDPVVIQGTLNANNVNFAGQEGSWGGLVFAGSSRQTSSLTNCHITDAILPIKIINSSPMISGLIIGSDTRDQENEGRVAIHIGSGSSAQLENIEISGYSGGIVIDNDGDLRATPTLSNIRVRNSTQTSRDQALEGTGLSVNGTANLDDIEIEGFDTGINVQNSSMGTPTLGNIRVRNSTQTSRDDTLGSTGAKVSGNVDIEDLDIDGYNTGVQIDGSQNTAATPTLGNIRVRNSTQTSRDDLIPLGMLISSNAAPIIEDMEILDMPRGILIQGDGTGSRTTPTLGNIRVRNSTQTSRGQSYGLSINDIQSVNIQDAEIKGYEDGILIRTTSRTISTPTLGNIRVRNSTQTSRTLGVGIDIFGSVEAQLEDIEIEDYNYGIKYQGEAGFRAISTPTLGNIRVRNSTQTSRSESYGIQLMNLDRVVLEDIEIEGYQIGLELANTQEYRAISTPTLGNIRVRNSTQTSRFDNIGILLGSGIAGSLMETEIENAKIGLMIADGNRSLISPLKIYNCATGIKAISLDASKKVAGHYIVNEPLFISQHPDWIFTGIELLGSGPWQIKNNSMVNMEHYLKANDAQGDFINNIAIGSPAPDQPFVFTNSNFNINYNDIYRTGSQDGVGNISVNPMFTDAEERDYTLTTFSPCIDAGSVDEPLDEDGTVSDIGAFTYLHKASIQPSHRFITPRTVVYFENTSWGHDHPFSTAEWDLGNDGIVDASSYDWSHQFDTPGVYDLKLTMHSGILNDVKEYTAFIVVQDPQLQAPTAVEISRVEGNIQISWQPVTLTAAENPVNVEYYLVYASDVPYGFFDYIGHSSDGQTSFVDLNAADAAHRFYFVIGFSGNYRELMDYINVNRSLEPVKAKQPTLRTQQ